MARRDRRRRAGEPSVEELAAELGRALPGRHAGEGWAKRTAVRLVDSARDTSTSIERAADIALRVGLAAAWLGGWQPVDAWQVIRRRGGEDAAAFVVGAIADEFGRYAEAAVHPRWRDQLAQLNAEVWWEPGRGHVAAYAERHGLDPVATVALVLEVLAELRALAPQPALIPPPGSPGAATASGPPPEVDPRVLARVRALLAKAESTDFPDEADAFFAKAQELMSRYSLQRAVLADPAASRPSTAGRRIWLDGPYLRPKSTLCAVVGSANRCTVVFTEDPGFVTVIGATTDLEFVELLTTSLLVQADRAMLAAGRQVDWRGQSRTRSFRYSFLVSYAQRIGERLADVADAARMELARELGDGRLLPVLASRERAVRERVRELFPRLVSRPISVSNAAGWTAGRAAADLAVLDVRRRLGTG
jgi:hypothetical protein